LSAPLLEVKNLRAGYGGVEVLHGVDLQLHQGQIAAIVGPNGAGKTTLMSALMSLLRATGDISLAGAPVGPTTEARVAQGMVLVPEKRGLFTDMSVADNLQLGAFQRYRDGKRDHLAIMQEVFELFPRLRERHRQRAGTLSGGERQMLALGRALMARPRLLLLDEPSLGLAPRIVADIFRTLATLRDQGLSILLVEQNARASLQIANYGYVLEMGRVALEGDSHILAADPRIIQAYIGARKDALLCRVGDAPLAR
jgi:branched-chain amino acid transport system ATP-binding protein